MRFENSSQTEISSPSSNAYDVALVKHLLIFPWIHCTSEWANPHRRLLYLKRYIPLPRIWLSQMGHKFGTIKQIALSFGILLWAECTHGIWLDLLVATIHTHTHTHICCRLCDDKYDIFPTSPNKASGPYVVIWHLYLSGICWGLSSTTYTKRTHVTMRLGLCAHNTDISWGWRVNQIGRTYAIASKE